MNGNADLVAEFEPLPPEITVTYDSNGNNISDGDTTPTSAEGTNFGSTPQGGSTISRTYRVTNDGGSSLSLSSMSVPAGYSLTNGLVSSLNPGASDTFTVRLDTSTSGTKSGQVSFSTNDSNEDPFNFSITGVVEPPPATIVVTANPSNGGSVSGSGTFPVGSSRQISASPNSGWTFTGWSDGNTSNPRTITVPSGAASYTANFQQQPTDALIDLTANPSNGGSVSGGGTYPIGSSRQISATANSGWTFTGWGDGNTSNPRTITVPSGGASYTALFTEAPTVAITFTTNPPGRGIVVNGQAYLASPQTLQLVPGSSLSYSVPPTQTGGVSTQYVFSSWADGGTSSNRTGTVPSSPTTYTANFTTQYWLTMTAGSGGTVTPSSGWQNAGAQVSITASPNPGQTFAGWTGSGSGSYTGSNNPATVTVNGLVMQTASFEASELDVVPLVNAQAVPNLSGPQAGALYFSLEIPSGTSSASFAISGGSGDCDLYVRLGQVPTTSEYDYRPWLGGNNETVTIPSPQAGTYFIMLLGYQAFSGVTLVGSFEGAPLGFAPTPREFVAWVKGPLMTFGDTRFDSAELDESGSVDVARGRFTWIGGSGQPTGDWVYTRTGSDTATLMLDYDPPNDWRDENYMTFDSLTSASILFREFVSGSLINEYTYPVTFSGRTVALELTPPSTTIDASATSYVIQVSSDRAWTASSNQAWATVSQDSGDGDGNVTVNVSSNSATAARSAEISIGGLVHQLSQAGEPSTRIIGLTGNLAFGDVVMGQTATETLTISNSGNSTLTVTSIDYSASGFSGNWSGTIAAGESQPVTVSFTPNAVQSYSGNVTVTSDATSGASSLPISGAGSTGVIALGDAPTPREFVAWVKGPLMTFGDTRFDSAELDDSGSVEVGRGRFTWTGGSGQPTGDWTYTRSGSDTATLMLDYDPPNDWRDENYMTFDSLTSASIHFKEFVSGSLINEYTYPVTFSGRTVALELTPPSTTIDASATSYVIQVSSDRAWTASSNQAWATVSPDSGNGDGSVTVTVSNNPAMAERSAQISIGGLVHQLSQAGTSITPPPAPVIQPPSGITASGFTANWSLSSGAIGYRLDVATNSAFTNFVSGFNDLDVGNVTSRSVTGLASGTTYWYRVRAANAGGTSGDSAPQSALLIPAAPVLGTPTSISGTGFTVNWSSSTGATGYRLDVATSSTFTNFVSGFNDQDVGNVTSRSVTGLASGTTYWYRVRAYNGSGESNDTSDNITLGSSNISVTHSASGYRPGSQMDILIALDYPSASLSGIGYALQLPNGWSYVEDTGSAGVKPQLGDTGLLEWAWFSIPPSSTTMTVTIAAPVSADGAQSFSAEALFTNPQGQTWSVSASPNPLIVPMIAFHSADTDQNWRIRLTELLGVITLYNHREGTSRTGDYHWNGASYSPGVGNAGQRSGPVHSADINANWQINLTELLGVISLYNFRSGTSRTGEYHYNATQGGYLPGPDPAAGGASAFLSAASASESEMRDGVSAFSSNLSGALRNLSGSLSPDGGTVDVEVELIYSRDQVSALGIEMAIPLGWSMVSEDSGAGVQPSPGQTGALEWAWFAIPASPKTFTVTLQYPAGQAETTLTGAAITGLVGGGQQTAGLNLIISPGTGISFSDAMADAGLVGNDALPTATPWKDGVPNLLKYAFNMDLDGPDNRGLERGTGTAGLPNITPEPGGGPMNVFRFEFLRRKGSGLIYTPKKSETLTSPSWVPLTDVPEVISIDAQWERVIYEEPYDPQTTERCFGRVEVTLPGG